MHFAEKFGHILARVTISSQASSVVVYTGARFKIRNEIPRPSSGHFALATPARFFLRSFCVNESPWRRQLVAGYLLDEDVQTRIVSSHSDCAASHAY